MEVRTRLFVTDTSDYLVNTDPTAQLTTNLDFYGEALSIGGVGAPTAGNCYYYNSSSGWTLTNAVTVGNVKGLLGIATSGAGFNRGMLIRGYYQNTSWTFAPGRVLYLSTTAGGITDTQPNSSGNGVRIVGFALSSQEIYFNPSNDWIELA